jgi:hypothetical protein
LKQRLTLAFSEHLHEIDPTELPKDVRGDFRDLMTRVNSAVPMRGETAVAATVRKMSNQEAELCARAVVELMARSRPDRDFPLEAGASVVTLYAAMPEGVPPLVAVSRA